MREPVRLICMVAVCALLSACSSTINGTPRAADAPVTAPPTSAAPPTSSAPPAKTVSKACPLVSAQQMAKDFGVSTLSATEGKPQSQRGYKLYSCSYRGSSRIVVTLVGNFPDVGPVSTELDGFVRGARGKNATRVNDLADGAVLCDIARDSVTLRSIAAVQKTGDGLLLVAILTSRHTGVDEHLKNAAKHALA